jgi:hypothetical protein
LRDTIRSLRIRGGRKHPMATHEKGEVFVGPGEGAHLPVLRIVHKITADRSRSRSGVFPQG